MKSILILTDFSPATKQAIGYIKENGLQLGIERIMIYHSFGPQGIDTLVPDGFKIPILGDEHQLFENSIAALQKLRNELLETLIDVEIDVLIDSKTVVEAVHEIVKEKNVDLVVLGINGSDDGGKNSVGKIPAYLIKNHSLDLLLVPSSSKSYRMDNVMLACDLKNIVHILPDKKIKEFVRDLNAHLFVVNVGEENDMDAASLVQEQTVLHELIDDLNPEFHYLKSKDTVPVLLQFAQSKQVGLIVAVPLKRGFLENFIHKSETKKLTLNTNIPLLLIHKS
jgi:nucleotide-binding universal stress UspA family protein